MKRASFFATAGVLGSLLVLPAPSLLTPASPARAATSAATAATASTASTASTAPGYRVTSGHAARLHQSADGVSGLAKVQLATSAQLAALRGEPAAQGGSGAGAKPSARAVRAAQAKISRASAPAVGSASVTRAAATASPAATSTAKTSGTSTARTSGTSAAASGVSHAFNGVSDSNSQALINSPITPPDQGLCAGTDTTLSGSPHAVWEPVNEAARETTNTGATLRPDVGLGTIFGDRYSIGDPRCVYDPSSQTFYFTEIGYPVAAGPAADGNNTTIDVAVVNSKGAAAYQFDTSLNGKCFGDQPKTGFDSDALVISTDEYCGPKETKYEGAAIVAISKSQLAAEAGSVNDDEIGPVSIAGNPVTGLDPAVNTGSGTEYFVDSTSFLGAKDVPAASGHTLDLSALANTASVTTGNGTPRLTSTTLPSEEYVYPVPATSTGDGSVTTLSDGTAITSETAIQADDDRTSGPVNVTRDASGGINLWTAVDSAVTPRGDTATRDGSAWFEISTAKQKVISQGYTAVKGENLVYPAIEALPNGPVAQVFTMTGPGTNPSIAYNKPEAGGGVTTVAAGAGPHVSFSDTAPYFQSRWGDYSMAVPDPDGSGIWLATEYIPPASSQDPYDNWGTYVFEVPAG